MVDWSGRQHRSSTDCVVEERDLEVASRQGPRGRFLNEKLPPVLLRIVLKSNNIILKKLQRTSKSMMLIQYML